MELAENVKAAARVTGTKLAEYAKAATSFLVVGFATYQAARLGSSPGGEAVTLDEWIGIGVTGLVAGFAVWLVPNAPAAPK